MGGDLSLLLLFLSVNNPLSAGSSATSGVMLLFAVVVLGCHLLLLNEFLQVAVRVVAPRTDAKKMRTIAAGLVVSDLLALAITQWLLLYGLVQYFSLQLISRNPGRGS